MKINFISIIILLNSLFCITKCNELGSGATCVKLDSSDEFVNLNSNTFMTNYFAHLNHYTSNISGSCVFNSLNLILDYYDSFWDDNIIPEKYDLPVTDSYNSLGYIESAASTYQKFDETKHETANIFYNWLDDNNFVKKLIDIAVDNNIIKDPRTEYRLKMDYLMLVNLTHVYLDKYTSSTCTFNEIGYDIYQRYNMYEFDDKLTNNEYLRQETIKLIQNNIPVILMVSHDHYAGHAVVAYDYDPFNDIIYCHYGRNGENHVNANKEYEYIRSMYAISPKYWNTHFHSNNYKDNRDIEYCSCKLLTHEHNFIGKSFKHSHDVKCFCGVHHIGNHFVNSNNVCVFCKRYVDEDDEYAGNE